MSKFVKNKAKFDELSSYLEDDCMSTFQLKDILTFNNDFESIKSELKSQVKMCKDFKDMSLMDIRLIANKQIQKNELEMKIAKENRKELPPSYDIKKLLSENNLKDAYKKVEEHNLDQEAFWGLDDAKIKELLGIEAFGERKHLVKVMAEIKKKHDEEYKKKT